MPADPAPAAPLTGVILAGGQARRMGGRDKGLIEYRGRPLLAHVIERLAPQVDTLLVNANRNRAQYAAFGHPVIADAAGGFLGPLAGILAGLQEAQAGLVLVAPCDSPHVSRDLAARLAAPLADAGTGGAVACCEGRMQPVFAILRTALAEPLAAFLQQGGRKIDMFYAAQAIVEVPFEDAYAFRNINTPEDLQH